MSPLLQGKSVKQRETAYNNLAPFWAVPRCAREFPNENNLELKKVPLDLLGLRDPLNSLAKRTKSTSFRATVQVMMNKKVVKPGEVLTFPFM